MNDGKKVLFYLDRVKLLAAIWKSINVVIKNYEMKMAVLNSFSESYETLITDLDLISTDALCSSYKLKKSRLLQKEQRCKMRESLLLSCVSLGVYGCSSENGGKYA